MKKEYFIEEFREKMSADDLAQSTMRLYVFAILKFITYYEKNYGSFSPQLIHTLDVIEFRENMISKDYASRSINNLLAGIFKYFEFIEGFLVIENPCRKIKKIKIEKSLYQEKLSKADFKKIRKEILTNAKRRDQLIFIILANTGVRISELVNLKVKDINIKERSGSMTINCSKGLKTRIVPLNNVVRLSINDYLESRVIMSKYLLTNTRGEPLDKSTINKMLNKYGKRLGIKIYPHALRHYFAIRYLESSGNTQTSLLRLQKILGHTSINTTMHYLSIEEEDNSIENLLL